MLAAPLLVGVLAARPSWRHLLLAAFWGLGYFAFFATGLWLKSHRKARYLAPVRTYAVATAIAGAAVLLVRPDLVRWAPLFLPPLAVGLVASAQRNDRSLVSGVATAAGSCLMAPVAYDLGGGDDWQRAWLMAAVLGAYFAGTVFYVKNLIRERDSRLHWWLSVGFHALATVGMLAVSPWAAALFAALTVRAALVPRLHPTPKQAGMGEIAGTVLTALVALLAV
jgi:YwiC-like protein